MIDNSQIVILGQSPVTQEIAFCAYFAAHRTLLRIRKLCGEYKFFLLYGNEQFHIK
jgi:hypothetical protein